MSTAVAETSTPIGAKDYFGRPIEPGMTLAYPGRKASDMWMNHMEVTHVQPWEDGGKAFFKVTGYNQNGVSVTITEIGRAVVVAAP